MKTTVARRMRRRRGFTLMEILLVLAILVILGSIVGVSYNMIRKNALIDSAKTQINLLEQAVNHYQLDVGNYPPTLSELLVQGDAPQGKWRGPYYAGTQLPLDPWGAEYNYVVDSDGRENERVRIYSNGPDRQEGSGDDVEIIR